MADGSALPKECTGLGKPDLVLRIFIKIWNRLVKDQSHGRLPQHLIAGSTPASIILPAASSSSTDPMVCGFGSMVHRLWRILPNLSTATEREVDRDDGQNGA
jgi:hypothetical protein